MSVFCPQIKSCLQKQTKGSGRGTHVNPWLIHFNVWQNPLQYCKVISLQLIKKKKKADQITLQEHVLASSVFQRREGRFLSTSPAVISVILSLKSYLRPWRELFKGKHKCIKKLSWGLFIADFAKYVNLYSTHFQMTWRYSSPSPEAWTSKKFISLINFSVKSGTYWQGH